MQSRVYRPLQRSAGCLQRTPTTAHDFKILAQELRTFASNYANLTIRLIDQRRTDRNTGAFVQVEYRS
jgi:hypothetical protein